MPLLGAFDSCKGHNLNDIISLFQNIPDLVWAALIASLLTLSGVYFTNKQGRKLLEKQLNHDAKKIRIDRSHDLKKDVFLEAAASFSKAISVIGKLSNLETPVEDLAQILDNHSPIASKMYLIASEDTVEKALDISNEVSSVYLELLTERRTFQNAKSEIEGHRAIIQKSHSEKDRVLETMKEMNLSGVQDKSKFDYLNGLFDMAEETRTKAATAISELEQKHNSDYRVFVKRCVKEYAILSIGISELIVAVRSELNTANDNLRFSTIMEKAMDDMNDNFEAFVDKTADS